MECLNCNRTPITRAIILTENRPWLRKISFAAEYFQLNARCLTFLFVFYRAIYIQFALRCCRQLVYSNIGQKKGDDTCLKLNATCNCQAEQTKCFWRIHAKPEIIEIIRNVLSFPLNARCTFQTDVFMQKGSVLRHLFFYLMCEWEKIDFQNVLTIHNKLSAIHFLQFLCINNR